MWEQRISRLFSIVGQLSPYSQCTVHDLASEYGCDEKTIERDIRILTESKLGIYTDEKASLKIHKNGYKKIRSWMNG